MNVFAKLKRVGMPSLAVRMTPRLFAGEHYIAGRLPTDAEAKTFLKHDPISAIS